MGENLKSPRYPIFVLVAESHYTTLFSKAPVPTTAGEVLPPGGLELWYYDQLASQQEEIRLTITAGSAGGAPPGTKEALVPPIEHCIRTKWRGAVVDWNGTDPLL